MRCKSKAQSLGASSTLKACAMNCLSKSTRSSSKLMQSKKKVALTTTNSSKTQRWSMPQGLLFKRSWLETWWRQHRQSQDLKRLTTNLIRLWQRKMSIRTKSLDRSTRSSTWWSCWTTRWAFKKRRSKKLNSQLRKSKRCNSRKTSRKAILWLPLWRTLTYRWGISTSK